jgi:hypothetical protein
MQAGEWATMVYLDSSGVDIENVGDGPEGVSRGRQCATAARDKRDAPREKIPDPL